MSTIYTTKDGDTVDHICWQYYTQSVLESAIAVQEPDLLDELDALEDVTDVIDISKGFENNLDGMVERVLEINTGLADYGPILPNGVKILLPDTTSIESDSRNVIQLWT